MKKYWIWLVLFCGCVVQTVEAKRDFYVEAEVNCEDGMCYLLDGQPLNGKLRHYYPNGVVGADVEYQNGVRNGVQQKFFDDGKQWEYVVFVNGKLHGMASHYYKNGNIEFEEPYDNGLLNGVRRAFYEDGTLRVEETYVAGVKSGKERRYYPEGKLQAELFYDNGKVVSAVCWNASGARIDFTDKAEEYIPQGIIPCRGFMVKLL